MVIQIYKTKNYIKYFTSNYLNTFYITLSLFTNLIIKIMGNIIVHFNIPNTSSAQYDAVWKDLRAAGFSNPKGLISHVGGMKGNDLIVVDVWESQEAFNEFGNTLMPLLKKNGFPDVQPQIIDAHYVYTK